MRRIVAGAIAGLAVVLGASPAVWAVPPNAPDPPSVAAGNGQITVTFNAPASDSAITGYSSTCTSSDGGTPGTNTGGALPLPIDVTGLDNGKTYTCTVTATNLVDGDGPPSGPSAPVVPSTVPGAPAQPTVVRGNGQITVTFSAPVSNGGSAITGYSSTCTSSNGGTSGSNIAVASPIVVTGLTNGKTYTCIVTAANATGLGPPSPPSEPAIPAAPPTVPGPPTIGVASGPSSGTMSVAFTPGSNGGSAILFYTATCTGGGTSGFATGPQSPIVVTGLTDSKVYTCRVTATNALGTSLPSAPSTPSVVGGAPGAPTIVEVRPLATFSATGALAVFFTVGPNNGTAITSFHASCTSTTGGVGGSSDGAHGPIVVSGLTTGARYLCTTTATNAKGTSPDSLAVKGVVGAPVKPALLRVLSMPNGLAVAIAPGPNNGSAIISYRARCTSTNGGLPSSPLQVVSPIIVSSLTPGATYTCRVTANNLRGEGPPSVSAAAVVGTPFTKVTCTGSAGTMNADHGLYLSRTEPQTFALDATASNCNGSYVTAGRIRASFRTATPTTCPNLTTVTSGGSGTLTWTAPTGLGTAGATLQLVFVSTAGHVTQAHFSGTVTSKGNLFTQRHVSGNITLNRGLKPVASGGDCTALIPLTTFAVTAISFSIT